MRAIDRIAQYIEHKGLSDKSFQDSIGVGNGYIASQKKGKGGLGSDILEKILKKYPDLNIIWVITGDGDMLLKPGHVDIYSPDLDPDAIMDEYYKRKEELKKEIIDDIIKKLSKE